MHPGSLGEVRKGVRGAALGDNCIVVIAANVEGGVALLEDPVKVSKPIPPKIDGEERDAGEPWDKVGGSPSGPVPCSRSREFVGNIFRS